MNNREFQLTFVDAILIEITNKAAKSCTKAPLKVLVHESGHCRTFVGKRLKVLRSARLVPQSAYGKKDKSRVRKPVNPFEAKRRALSAERRRNVQERATVS